MPNLILADLAHEIEANVRRALAEDIGSGDITAQLIPAERLAHACLADPRVTRARVRVDKPNALAPHATGGVEVTAIRS